jgi:hypothetical protein
LLREQAASDRLSINRAVIFSIDAASAFAPRLGKTLANCSPAMPSTGDNTDMPSTTSATWLGDTSITDRAPHILVVRCEVA